MLIPKYKSKNKFCAYVTQSFKEAREDIGKIVLVKFNQTRNTDRVRPSKSNVKRNPFCMDNTSS